MHESLVKEGGEARKGKGGGRDWGQQRTGEVRRRPRGRIRGIKRKGIRGKGAGKAVGKAGADWQSSERTKGLFIGPKTLTPIPPPQKKRRYFPPFCYKQCLSTPHAHPFSFILFICIYLDLFNQNVPFTSRLSSRFSLHFLLFIFFSPK
jgi:hypothetical protein